MGSALFKSLEWRMIGPHRGGRVVAVAGHPIQRETFYFGAVSGGVWKTTSGGALWENISDGYFKTSAVGALAVSDADPNVIYAGMGETSIRSNVSHGDGVYKSTDSGATWRNVGLEDTRHIGKIQIHPKNPDIVYVAAFGHAWGRNAERGVYRTTDGGKSWEKVLYTSDRAGAIDISMDQNNPRVIYAAMWEAQRYPHMLSSGGEGSGIWKTTDGGDTWTDITRNKGLPEENILGKIGVAVSPARTQSGRTRVWAMIEAAEKGGLYRSDDDGETWQLVCDNPDLRRRPWYYMHVYADPSDVDTVWILNLACWKSIDGGRNFEQIPTPHGDNHGLWIDPRDSNRMIEGNDGGACVTFDGGYTWSSILNQPTAQFYHVTTDNQTPYNVYGSQQDNWAMRLPSIGFEGAITWKDYVEPGGGESGYIAISPNPPHRVYGGGIGTGLGHGRLLSWDPETRQARNITVWPEVHGFGAGADQLRYRFQWTFPIEFSPHDPNVLYVCSNVVHRSTDEGTSWQEISPDLTRNDRERIRSSGGPITADNSGAEIYCTIFAFRESAREQGVFWAGSDDGLVHISRDGGTNWQLVTPPDLPEWSQIMIIEPSAHEDGVAYVCATAYKQDDTRPYLFRTKDYGASWKLIVNGIPDSEFTRVVREDSERPGLLFTGTETGVHVSFDDGDIWERLETNLPITPIHDLQVKGADLIAATHGRSFWILDDITPLRQMDAGLDALPAKLFAPRQTTRYRQYGRAFGKTMGITNYKMTGPLTVAYRPVETPTGATREEFLDAGSNPPDGVVIHYWLKEKPEGEVKLEILDRDGATIREFSTESKDPLRVSVEPGANRFVWNMRHEKATPLEDPPKTDRFAAMMEEAVAPRAVPGRYEARLTVDGAVMTESFEIVPDPRIRATSRDLNRQFELKLAIRDELSTVNAGLNQLRKVRKQVEYWEERVKDGDEKDAADVARELRETLTEIEMRFINTDADKPQPGVSQLREKLIGLSVMIDESDDPPTKGAQEVFAMLADQVEATQARLRQLLDGDARKLAKLLDASKAVAIAT